MCYILDLIFDIFVYENTTSLKETEYSIRGEDDNSVAVHVVARKLPTMSIRQSVLLSV